jgi:hypothetical protein
MRRRYDDRDDLPTDVLLRDYPFEMVRLPAPDANGGANTANRRYWRASGLTMAW